MTWPGIFVPAEVRENSWSLGRGDGRRQVNIKARDHMQRRSRKTARKGESIWVEQTYHPAGTGFLCSEIENLGRGEI